MKKLLPRFAIFLIAIVLISGSCYACVKIFNFDKVFTSYFDKSEEELSSYGVSGTDVGVTKKFDDAVITIRQTVLDEKEIYLLVAADFKEDDTWLSYEAISRGNVFNENILNFSYLEDGSKYYDIDIENEDSFHCSGNGSANMSEDGLYALTFNIDSSILGENESATLRLITNKDKYYDIPFTLSKNYMKSKETKFDKNVYDKGGIIINVSSIRLTPFHVIVDMNYNKDVRNLTDDELEEIYDEVYNENLNSNTYVTYKDGSTTKLRLNSNPLTSPYGIHGTKQDQINDIENIKSVTINGVTFEIE